MQVWTHNTEDTFAISTYLCSSENVVGKFLFGHEGSVTDVS